MALFPWARKRSTWASALENGVENIPARVDRCAFVEPFVAAILVDKGHRLLDEALHAVLDGGVDEIAGGPSLEVGRSSSSYPASPCSTVAVSTSQSESISPK